MSALRGRTDLPATPADALRGVLECGLANAVANFPVSQVLYLVVLCSAHRSTARRHFRARCAMRPCLQTYTPASPEVFRVKISPHGSAGFSPYGTAARTRIAVGLGLPRLGSAHSSVWLFHSSRRWTRSNQLTICLGAPRRGAA